jgi:NAD+ diphosphatase
MKNIVHAFAGSPLDRAGVKRPDAAWIAEQAHSASARFLPFIGLSPVVHASEDAPDRLLWLSGADLTGNAIANLENALFLGLDDRQTARFAVALDDTKDWSDLGPAVDLRALAVNGTIDDGELAIAGQAKSMLEWHRQHGFCARCGTADNVADGGYKRVCPKCERMHFPRVDPVAIMLVTRGDKCLLGRSPHFVPGMYSTLAGFMEPGESIEETVRREVMEEAGVSCGHVAYHSSQPWPFASSIMIGCIAQATSDEIKIDPGEIEDARWFGRDEIQLMRERKHPEELTIPFRFAIARHLIKAFLDGWEG